MCLNLIDNLNLLNLKIKPGKISKKETAKSPLITGINNFMIIIEKIKFQKVCTFLILNFVNLLKA